MKFLIDAQLPVRLSLFLQRPGYDTIHTRDLPRQNATPDTEVNTISIQESRIVITKDSDFLDSFLICQEPYKLLLVTTSTLQMQNLRRYFKAIYLYWLNCLVNTRSLK